MCGWSAWQKTEMSDCHSQCGKLESHDAGLVSVLSACCQCVVCVICVLSECCQCVVGELSVCYVRVSSVSVVCIFYCMRTWCVVWERRGLSNIATVTRGGRSLKLVNCWLSCSLICMCVIHSWMWKTIFQPDVVLILLWVHACVSYCKWVTVYVCIRCLSVCYLIGIL